MGLVISFIKALFELDLIDAPLKSYQRRNIINTIKHDNLPDNIDIMTEYIEMLDGIVLYSKCFIPKNIDINKETKMLLMCPGYKGRIDGHDTVFCSNIASKYGYIVFIYDHYGHGKSDGIWLGIDDKYQLINHAMYIFEYAKNKYTNILNKQYNNNLKSFKYILMGHSMGAGIITRLMEFYNINQKKYIYDEMFNTYDNRSFLFNFNKYNNNIVFHGSIMLAPFLGVSKRLMPSNIMIKFGEFITTYINKYALSPTKSSLNPEYSSRDKKFVDELTHGVCLWNYRQRILTGLILIKIGIDIQYKLSNIDLPFITFHGTNDMINNIEFTQKLFNESKTDIKSKKFIKMDGGRHILYMDTCKNEINKYINDWISSLH